MKIMRFPILKNIQQCKVNGVRRHFHHSIETKNEQKQLSYWDLAALEAIGKSNPKNEEENHQNEFMKSRKQPTIRNSNHKNYTKRDQRGSQVLNNLLNNEDEDILQKSKNFDLITFNSLSSNINQIPHESIMLTRDFIDLCLYHSKFGYFSKQALIFSPSRPIEFNKIENDIQFSKVLEGLYKNLDDRLEDVDDKMRQVWHTPTELFKPWFGYSMAKYIIEEYLKDIKKDPNHPLIIYEIGAGNGTLMTNIIQYFIKYEPELTPKIEYHIIEISAALAKEQNRKMNLLINKLKFKGKIDIVNESILTWSSKDTRKCFVLMSEVVDNFAHDVIVYNESTGEPMQGMVCVTNTGDFKELFTDVRDSMIHRFLHLSKDFLETYYPHNNNWLNYVKNTFIPFSNNENNKMFIPTGLLRLLDILFEKLPAHRLILSDFDSLPDSIPGINAPVVQTRYNGAMIPCSTYLVQPGYFDIFFPTNFELFRDMYLARNEIELIEYKRRNFLNNNINDKDNQNNKIIENEILSRNSRIKILKHNEFSRKYALYENTKLKSGENPLLSWYGNFKFILT